MPDTTWRWVPGDDNDPAQTWHLVEGDGPLPGPRTVLTCGRVDAADQDLIAAVPRMLNQLEWFARNFLPENLDERIRLDRILADIERARGGLVGDAHDGADPAPGAGGISS